MSSTSIHKCKTIYILLAFNLLAFHLAECTGNCLLSTSFSGRKTTPKLAMCSFDQLCANISNQRCQFVGKIRAAAAAEFEALSANTF